MREGESEGNREQGKEEEMERKEGRKGGRGEQCKRRKTGLGESEVKGNKRKNKGIQEGPWERESRRRHKSGGKSKRGNNEMEGCAAFNVTTDC